MRYWLDAGDRSLSTDRPRAGATVRYEATGEGVTFWTAPFAADTEFTGPVAAKLFVSSSTTDLDLFLTLRIFDAAGDEVTFQGANDPQAPVSQGWLRLSQRKLDPTRSAPYRPVHPHDGQEKLTPGAVYEADVEVWPTSIVCPAGYRLALTVAGTDFQRSDAKGPLKGSGPFLHDDPTDRPAAEFGGIGSIHTGGEHGSYLLLPAIAP